MKRLQLFDFLKNANERPNEKWVCGRLESGKACRVGPNRRGKCQATYECVPSKTGGKWHCLRSLSDGGQCQEGPLADGTCCNPIPACKPVRTLRAKRGAVSKWVAILFIGFVVLTISYASNTQLLMPGPMTTAHSPLSKCGDCHSNITGGQFDWLHAIVASANPRKDSDACLTCHKMGPAALNPHGLASDKLEVLTKRLQSFLGPTSAPMSARVRNVVFPVQNMSAAGVFCATCHKEHQGKKIDLKAMADVRCQSCHTVQFDSFQNDHPKFNKYPFRRRTRVNFDHSKHFGDHIPKTLAKNKVTKSTIPGVCADCHTIGAEKRHMDVKPFAEMCSSCHLGQIVGAERATGPKGIAFFTLPGLDVATLKKRNAAIGEWPEQAEAELTPLMKLLIGWDEGRRQLLNKLSKLDLLDLSEATAEEIAAVEKFAWEVKFLLYALSTTKTSDVMKRISSATGTSVDPDLIAKLTATMPRDVLVSAQREWLPNLSAEIAKRGYGDWITSIVNTNESGASISSFRARKYAAQGVSDLEPISEKPTAAAQTGRSGKEGHNVALNSDTGNRTNSKKQKERLVVAQSSELRINKFGEIVGGSESSGSADDRSRNENKKSTERPSGPPPAREKAKPAERPSSDLATSGDENAKPEGGQTDDLLVGDENATPEDRPTDDVRVGDEKSKPAERTPGDLATSGDENAKSDDRQTDDLLVGDDIPTPEDGPTDDVRVGDEKGLPADTPADNRLTREEKSKPKKRSPKTLAGDKKRRRKSVDESAKRDTDLKAKSAASNRSATSGIDAETWAEFGGWYRQDFSILYKPTGHADGFLRAWLDFTGRLFEKAETNLASPVFNLLTAKDAQGQCTKCHSVDSGSGGSRKINWKPSSISTRASRFTSFAHEPHFGLLGEKGCLTCHDVSAAAGYQDTYKAHDPNIFVSNFKPVEQKRCATCHGKNVAREDCLLCHKYHVTDVKTPIMTTKIPK
ncbi:hypothetical protein MnTg02_01743 [bacterium MnTg02]|nr:hypothetical protein MnTg02_01743 [bacterium MnTg02]